MGMSTPTVTDTLRQLRLRMEAFARELEPHEQQAWHHLVDGAHRAMSAINQAPDMDAERPILYAMLAHETAARLHLEARLQHLEQLHHTTHKEIDDVLGLAPRRSTRPPEDELDRLGQTRLPSHITGSAIPTRLPRRPTPRATRTR